MSEIYCTTFCNQGHRLSDGKPVGHECYVLRPKALRAEADGDVEKALEIGIRTERTHRGVKEEGEPAPTEVVEGVPGRSGSLKLNLPPMSDADRKGIALHELHHLIYSWDKSPNASLARSLEEIARLVRG